MARKPKVTRTTKATATGAEPKRPAPAEMPAPARRGRPPKTAQAASQAAAAENSDDLAIGIADSGASGAGIDAGGAPAQKRQGRKPKATGSVAAAFLRNEPRRVKGSQARKLDDAEDAAEAEDAALVAEAVEAGGLSAGSGSPDRKSDEGKAADEPPPPAALNTAASPQPAAHWDRATDTVRFDWPKIEQTAAQQGANQVMAKLLITARAEGANSRWPL